MLFAGLMTATHRERAALQAVVETIETLDAGIGDARELIELAAEEDDTETVATIEQDVAQLEARLNEHAFRQGERSLTRAEVRRMAGDARSDARRATRIRSSAVPELSRAPRPRVTTVASVLAS